MKTWFLRWPVTKSVLQEFSFMRLRPSPCFETDWARLRRGYCVRETTTKDPFFLDFDARRHNLGSYGDGWRLESFIARRFCSRLSVGFDQDSDVRDPRDSRPDPQPSSCLFFRITEVSHVSFPVPMSLRSLQRDWLAASLDVPPGFAQYAHFLNFYCRLYNLLCTKRNGHPLCKRHWRTNSKGIPQLYGFTFHFFQALMRKNISA